MQEFISESQYEDFYRDEQEVVYISTIHRSKGREFDNVYMLLQNCYAYNDEKKRTLYVGMTRAKSELYIHCNTSVFNNFSGPGVTFINDPNVYREPDEIIVQLTHEDVYLDYFKFRQNVIKKLRSGMVLSVQDNLLYFNNQETQIPVICFSKAFKNKLLNWKAKGYLPISAHVQFIVSWKGEKDDKESYIILPIIRLKRSSKT